MEWSLVLNSVEWWDKSVMSRRRMRMRGCLYADDTRQGAVRWIEGRKVMLLVNNSFGKGPGNPWLRS